MQDVTRVRPGFPLPDTDWGPTREFWAGAARHELRIPRCDACGALAWYPRARCRACRGEAFTWALTSGRGSLFSWAVVTHPFLPEFATLVPFVPALVALEDDPAVRLVTRLVECEPDQLTFDLPLHVVFRPLQYTGVEGSVPAPFFRPVPSRGGR